MCVIAARALFLIICIDAFCSLVKYQQLETDSASGKKYAALEEADLNKLLTQTDIFIETCNMEQVRYVTEFCKYHML